MLCGVVSSSRTSAISTVILPFLPRVAGVEDEVRDHLLDHPWSAKMAASDSRGG